MYTYIYMYSYTYMYFRYVTIYKNLHLKSFAILENIILVYKNMTI